MRADCQCIEGSIDKVDKIDLIFDYAIADIEGAAEVTLYDFQAMYNMTPEVTKIDESVAFHEQGMLHLKINELNLAAFDFPIKIHSGGAMKDAVRTAFEALLVKFLSSEEPVDASQTEFVDTIINQSFISYDQHTHLYEETMEIDYQLVGEGVHVTDDYVSLIMDGTFHSIRSDADEKWEDEGDSEHLYASPLPLHLDDQGSAQVFISDYTLNSLVNAAIDLDWFNFERMFHADDID